MIGAHAFDDDSEVPTQLLSDLSESVDSLADRITTAIQQQVRSYAGPAAGRRRWLIGMAIQSAARHFFEMAQGRPASVRKVDDLFAKMGHGEATDGQTIEPIMAALGIAILMAWDEIRAAAVAHDTSAAVLSQLSELLHTEADHLRAQVRTGYEAGLRTRRAETARPQDELLDALLTRSRASDLGALARRARWPLPDEILVAQVRRRAEGPAPWVGLPVLVSMSRDPQAVVVAATLCDQFLDALAADDDLVQATISWPVPPSEATDAHRWGRRALDLARRGVLPDDKVLDCTDYRTELWLHADPTLRRQLCQDLLPPLLAETPNSREILSETLLAWLETRESAPAIAARLDVHPQTVRYRWKRINELFGDALHDPDLVVQLTMLLKASVPMWKAGDQSDFERFQAETD